MADWAQNTNLLTSTGVSKTLPFVFSRPARAACLTDNVCSGQAQFSPRTSWTGGTWIWTTGALTHPLWTRRQRAVTPEGFQLSRFIITFIHLKPASEAAVISRWGTPDRNDAEIPPWRERAVKQVLSAGFQSLYWQSRSASINSFERFAYCRDWSLPFSIPPFWFI